jgi:short-subunit dehydrogenase
VLVHLDPRIHVPSSRNSLSLASLNYGQVSRSKMDPRPDHGEQSYKGSGRLAGRKALITGGDSGMGRAAAIAYAREGVDVAINYFPTEEPDAREVIELIKAEGRKAIALPGDLRDEAFCKRLVADTVNALGGLDIVVNNAGRQQSHESIEDIPPSSLTGQ